MKQNETKNLTKNLDRFVCEKCNFKCYMKCDWDRHTMRAKHIANVTGNNGNKKNLKKTYQDLNVNIVTLNAI